MSANRTKINFKLDVSEISGRLGADKVARVGVLAATNQREDDQGVTNAEIGLVHEFGSKTQGIPERSFLKLPLEMKRKELMKVLDSGAAKAAFEANDTEKIFELLGLKAEEIIQGAFESGGYGMWPALSQITVKKKGSSAILIDEGELRRAIISDVVNKSEVK